MVSFVKYLPHDHEDLSSNLYNYIKKSQPWGSIPVIPVLENEDGASSGVC